MAAAICGPRTRTTQGRRRFAAPVRPWVPGKRQPAQPGITAVNVRGAAPPVAVAHPAGSRRTTGRRAKTLVRRPARGGRLWPDHPRGAPPAPADSPRYGRAVRLRSGLRRKGRVAVSTPKPLHRPAAAAAMEAPDLAISGAPPPSWPAQHAGRPAPPGRLCGRPRPATRRCAPSNRPWSCRLPESGRW